MISIKDNDLNISLDKMIKGFASIIKDEESKNARKRQRRALDLFRKYFFCLGW